jgi:phenylacetate-CoA ligase
MRLAEVAQEEKIDLRNAPVRLIIVAGEPGGSIPAMRARLAELWPGARVFDHHGMTEVGPVTYECPARPGVLHVIESAYLAEAIESSSGKSVANGEMGELVLTTLGRVGAPLLRYRTGDLVKVETPTREQGACACGRYQTALVGGILGRTDDMIVVRGVNVYPSAVEEIVRGCDGVAEYRAQVDLRNSLAELSLTVEPRTDCADGSALVRILERAFEAALALRVPISLAPVGSLPRWEMKAHRWQVRR